MDRICGVLNFDPSVPSSGSLHRKLIFSAARFGRTLLWLTLVCHWSKVVRAAKIAAIHEDIMGMPMGYNTILADRGLSLSGGQRQRLAIARALARNPRIFIFDEATSHLDAVTEDTICNNLKSLRCTQVVIAHRLSTIRNADLILVLDAGKLVEQGTHETLLSGDNLYATLVGAQRDREGDMCTQESV